MLINGILQKTIKAIITPNGLDVQSGETQSFNKFVLRILALVGMLDQMTFIGYMLQDS